MTTGAVLGLAAHYYLGWTPDFRHFTRLPPAVFEVLTFLTLVSFTLAHAYLILLMLPAHPRPVFQILWPLTEVHIYVNLREEREWHHTRTMMTS